MNHSNYDSEMFIVKVTWHPIKTIRHFCNHSYYDYEINENETGENETGENETGENETGENAESDLSNASKEEYSIINLALILSNEKKIKNLISMIKDDLIDSIENNSSVLKINIKDPSINLNQILEIPKDDTTFVEDEYNTTSKHFNLKIQNVELK